MGGTALLCLGLLGLGARGTAAYLSPHPEACRTCHRMEAPYRAWKAGNHAKVPCQGCHVPEGAMPAMAHKLTTGLRHSAVNVLDRGPAPLRLDGQGLAVVEANCRRCHSGSGLPAAQIPGSPKGRPGDAFHAQASRDCTSCHATPHALPPGT